MSKSRTLWKGCLLRICYGSFYNDTLIFSGVSIWSGNPRISTSWHWKEKEIKKPRARTGNFTRAYGIIQRESRSIRAHPHIGFLKHASCPPLEQQAPCPVSKNTAGPQECKTAWMPHLLKQQDFHILRLCAEPSDKVALGTWSLGVRKRSKKKCFKTYFLPRFLSFWSCDQSPGRRHC